MIAYAVDHHAVLDITEPDTLARLGVDVRCPWRLLVRQGREPPTWRLARTLVAHGVGAILASSLAPGAAPRDRNLIFWRWNKTDRDAVTVIDDVGRLPRDGAFWR